MALDCITKPTVFLSSLIMGIILWDILKHTPENMYNKSDMTYVIYRATSYTTKSNIQIFQNHQVQQALYTRDIKQYTFLMMRENPCSHKEEQIFILQAKHPYLAGKFLCCFLWFKYKHRISLFQVCDCAHILYIY